MKKILAILAALLASLPASAQQVRQSGNVTPGHVTKWITTGVIGDGGPDPAGANPTSLNATASGFGICQFSGFFSGPYNRLCFNVTGTGGGFALDNFGGATGGFTWTLNGVTQGLPITTGLPVTINDFACFSDTTGDLKDCGNTNGVNSGTINQLAWYAASGAVVSGLATANNGALVTSAGGVPSISSTLPAAVQGNITTVGTIGTGVWQGTAIAVGFGGTGLTGGTSGGVPYFNSANTLASSGALTANAVMLGGGAGGAPTVSGCTIDANNTVSCASSVTATPAHVNQNTTSDASAASYNLQKNRSGGAVLNSDVLGIVNFSGFSNAAQRNAAQIQAIVSAAPSGSNVPTKVQISTSNAAGLNNQSLVFDNNGHLSSVSTSVPVVNTCAGFALGTGATDFAGRATFTSNASTCSFNFGTAFANIPFCTVAAPVTTNMTVTATTLTIGFVSAAATTASWICIGA